MSRAVVAIIGILLIGGVAIWGLQAAAADAGDATTIENESFQPDAGNITTLEHSGLNNTYYDETVEIRGEDGSLADPGEDYIWYQINGTVEVVPGGSLDGDTTATVTYGYQTTTSDQQALIGITSMLPNILGVLAPLLGVGLILLFLKG